MKKAVALVGSGPPSPGASSVPGFLAKLWSLVEDPGSDDVISWSRNGQNFCILDEQRFAKVLLPKYFKHNNLSSFIRQLNIYGFRKVIALENGMITSDKNSAIEFQHPFFKRGKIDLLANIKRKSTLTQVATVRPEDLKICPDDLHKVLSEVQEMREQQNSMDIKLESMKRENKALWKEVAFLRQKHNQQQQLLSKILEFILGLMRGNCILGVKRKRSLADASDPSAPKFSRQYVRIPVEDCETTALSEHGPDCQDSIIICDITDAQEEEEEDAAAPEKFLALEHSSPENWKAPVSTTEGIPTCKTIETAEPEVPQGDHLFQLSDGSLPSSAVELHTPQVNANEEAAAVIDSIINENQTTASSDSFLDREEIQDFLNCIDASLEELQAMLSGEKTNHASETLTDAFSPELPVLDSSIAEAPLRLEKTEDLPANLDTDGIMDEETSGKNDMQLIQYRGNPLLSLFEEPPSSEEDGRLGNTGGDLLGSMESNKAVQRVASPGSQTAGAAPLEPPLDQPLLSEDMNGEYKLFPLLLLSPVANFIEEASEIETS